MRATVRIVLPAVIAVLASCSSSSENNDGGSPGNDGGASSSGGSRGSSSGGQSSSGALTPGSSSSSGSSGSSAGSGIGSTAGSSDSSADSGIGVSSGSSGPSSGSASGSSSGSGSSSSSSGTCTVGSMPSGGTTCTCTAGSCTNCNSYSGGAADGLNYGIWESGTGGNITYFASAHAFSASWGPSSADFLAHVGLDYGGTASYTTYGKIVAQFAESRSGSAGGYSTVGIYGWLQSPCVEYYITDDSYQGLQKSNVMATIDGDTYYLIKQATTGTAGANACTGSVSSWTQLISVRATARQCGTITVSDHFAAWANQGWGVGDVSSIHINLDVGGGTGSIQFPTASVSVNN